METRRSHFLICFGFTVLLLWGYFFASDTLLNRAPIIVFQQQTAEQHAPDYDNFLVDTPSCRIRTYDPYDPYTLKTYFKSPPEWCKKLPPPLLKAVLFPEEGKSGVFLNTTILRKYYKLMPNEIICTYKVPVRNEKRTVIDTSYTFLESHNLTFNVPMDEEHLWVKCFHNFRSDKKPPKFFYEQPVMLAKVKEPRRSLDPYLERPPLNVLVLGMDSVSRLNFHRQYKESLEFIKSKENAVELFGYNKIGLNSGPNQIPILSGQLRRPPKTYFDNVTEYLWNVYESRGFRTMFFEEQWAYGLFVYPSLQGFKKVPTTYWPRPMMQAVDRSKLKNNGWCIGPRFPGEMYLDYLHDLFTLLNSTRPMFSYAWFSEVAHDTLNGAKRMDKPFAEFLRRMDADGILNNTALFFMSDHGFRFGDFRNTRQGKYEDDLPFAFVLLPDWYYKMRPQALKNLKTNSRRLVTAYDFHATFMELSDIWNEARPIMVGNGSSILSMEIPESRTCAEAGIELSYCECMTDKSLSHTDHLVTEMAAFVLSKVNDIVVKHNATHLCHQWKMGNITNALHVHEGQKPTDNYKISISVLPGPSLFDAVILYHKDSLDPKTKFSIVNNIDRTDWFSTHAKCAKATNYERYCYCIKQD